MMDDHGDNKAMLDQLHAALSGVSQALIVPHTNPDPDAVASAVGLKYLLGACYNIPATIGYQGVIGRAENRALVRYLGRPLRRLRGLRTPPATGVVVVDTQPGAGNCPIPADGPVRVVIDHHPPQPSLPDGILCDLRPALGASATIVTEYFQQAGLVPPPPIATALFYGIKTDTWGLARGATAADVAAYLYLQPLIEPTALLDIEQAQVPMVYFQQLYVAASAARMYGDVVVITLDTMAYPDVAGELADLLLRLEGMQWSVCLGAYEDVLLLSVRTRRKRGGAGRVVQAVVREDGTAGGHGMSAGGQIPLRGRAVAAVRSIIVQRLLMELGRGNTEGIALVTDVGGETELA